MARSLLRHTIWDHRDGLLVILVFVHGGVLLTAVLLVGLPFLRWPSIAVIALALWWNANTISHYFIHRPFFRRQALNKAFSCLLSLLLGFPHSLWRQRHLRHHLEHLGRQDERFLTPSPLDFGATTLIWGALLVFAPAFTFAVYLPGFLVGLALCFLQGHYEHFGGTVSNYGWLYNFLFLNDGYHVEHHAHPGTHWRNLPQKRIADTNTSRWPAVLRWLES